MKKTLVVTLFTFLTIINTSAMEGKESRCSLCQTILHKFFGYNPQQNTKIISIPESKESESSASLIYDEPKEESKYESKGITTVSSNASLKQILQKTKEVLISKSPSQQSEPPQQAILSEEEIQAFANQYVDQIIKTAVFDIVFKQSTNPTSLSLEEKIQLKKIVNNIQDLKELMDVLSDLDEQELTQKLRRYINKVSTASKRKIKKKSKRGAQRLCVFEEKDMEPSAQ